MLTWGLEKLHNRSDFSTSVCRNDNLNVTLSFLLISHSRLNHCKMLFLMGNLKSLIFFSFYSSPNNLWIYIFLCLSLLFYILYIPWLFLVCCILFLAFSSILIPPIYICLNCKTSPPIKFWTLQHPKPLWDLFLEVKILYCCHSFLQSQEEF